MEAHKQASHKPKRIKVIIVLLAVLLVLSAGGLAARMIYMRVFVPAQTTVALPDNLVGDKDSAQPAGASVPTLSNLETASAPEDRSAARRSAPASSEDKASAGSAPAGNPRAPLLELYQGKPGDNQAFEVRNLFPGDSETRYFCVRAYHDADISLSFRADVTEQTKALGDALRIKVTRLETGRVLCDAAFSEIDGKAFTELLKANASDETTAYYQIDVTLDTSVGNEYQAAMLRADFSWYAGDDSGLTPPPQTGDAANITLWILLAASSLLLLVILWKRRKEGGRHEQAE